MAWNETTQQQYRRLMVRYETDLTDAEWSVIEPLIPPLQERGVSAFSTCGSSSTGSNYETVTDCATSSTAALLTAGTPR